MSFEWAQYLNVARELIGFDTPPSSEDARLRAGISRAYYAVFNTARRYMQDFYYLKPPQEGIHTYVIDWFESYPDKMYSDIGQMLRRLRRHRVNADYQEKFERLRREARNAIRLAEAVLDLLAKLS